MMYCCDMWNEKIIHNDYWDDEIKEIIFFWYLFNVRAFPMIMLWKDFSPLSPGYKYLGRGDLVARRLEGCEGNCLPSILFLVRNKDVVECELWYVTPGFWLALNLFIFEFKSWELLSFLSRCWITREIFINEIRELFFAVGIIILMENLC